MKFRFCGDLDCPDWVLAEIATISKISSIKAKQLCTLVVTSILTEDELKLERLDKFANDSKLETSDIKACSSLIEFILASGAKNGVSSEVLSSELQQLGLPKEHSNSVCRVYDDKVKELDLFLKRRSLRLDTLESLDWRVDYIFGSSHMKAVNEPLVQLKFNTRNTCKDQIDHRTISFDSTALKLLIHEMKEAKKSLEAFQEAVN